MNKRQNNKRKLISFSKKNGTLSSSLKPSAPMTFLFSETEEKTHLEQIVVHSSNRNQETPYLIYSQVNPSVWNNAQ